MTRLWSVLLIIASLLSGQAFAEEEYWEYTFRPGDSVWNIARDYTNSVNNWHEISRINSIESGPDRNIAPGTRIKIPVSMLKQQPTPAVVIAVNGEVSLIRANGEHEPVEQGTRLYNGDQLITSDYQSVRIQFADKSELQMLANSDLSFDKLSYHEDTGMVDTRLRLPKGRVNTWIEKLKPKGRFEIQTPAALTAVRGTRYRLSSDENRITRTEVTEGVVAVSADGKEQKVKSGFGLLAEIGKLLMPPMKLLPAPKIGENQAVQPGLLHVFWERLDGAAEYRFQVARDEGFSDLILDDRTSETILSKRELEAGEYFVQIRGIAGNGLEGLNAVRKIKVAAAPVRRSGSDVIESVILPSGLILGQ